MPSPADQVVVVPLAGNPAQTAVEFAGLADQITGWAEYQDTQYTSGSPFALSADADTILPNNGGTSRVDQMPYDIAAMYIPGTLTIPGRQGDGINVFSYFTCVPATAAGNYIDWWLDIGSPVGELYRRTVTFPKGNGVAAGVSVSIAGFMYDTWASNGAKIYIRSTTTCNIYGIRLVLTRTHKAR